MQRRTQPTITLKSYNPYEYRFPNYKVVTRETLHLIKYLRTRNYKIIVDNEDQKALNYLAEKGAREFLADPIIAFIKDISLSIATNLFSSWLYDEWERRYGKGSTAKEVNIILEFEEKGRKVRFTHKGTPLNDETYIRLVETLIERSNNYGQLHRLTPPNSKFKYPITLEHTPKIVGWGEDMFIDSEGLRLGGIEITDEETLRRVKAGELRGFSIGGIIINSECSICNQQYVECNHIAGDQYDGVECGVEILGIRLADFSIVEDPINSRTLIDLDSRYQ